MVFHFMGNPDENQGNEWKKSGDHSALTQHMKHPSVVPHSIRAAPA